MQHIYRRTTSDIPCTSSLGVHHLALDLERVLAAPCSGLEGEGRLFASTVIGRWSQHCRSSLSLVVGRQVGMGLEANLLTTKSP